MNRLLIDAFGFFYWWMIEAPAKTFKILKRILTSVNYTVAFTLNIRLLFTPFFGDYTRVGRIIGFFFRIIWLFFGSIVVIFIGVVTLLAPLFWYLVPVFLVYYVKLWFIPIFIVTFVLHEFLTFNSPKKRVYQVDEKSYIKSFRPKVANYAELLDKFGIDVLTNILKEKESQTLLMKLELVDDEFIKSVLEGYNKDTGSVSLLAFNIAKAHGTRFVEMEHLLFAIVKQVDRIENLLQKHGVNFEMFDECVRWIVDKREELSRLYIWQEDYEMPPMGGVNRGMTGRVTKYLDAYSEDYTEAAKWGQFKKLTGREHEIETVVNLLGSSVQQNVLITGPAGSGKSSIVKGLANEIIHGTTNDELRFKRIVRLDSGLLVAGATTPGQLADRVSKSLKDAEDSGNVIVYIDKIHNLLSGSQNVSPEVSSAFAVLEPHLHGSKIQFIGSTSTPHYRKYIEPNDAFSRLFKIVEIPEATEEDTIKILQNRADEIEKHYAITVTYPAIVKAVKLSKKMIHERVLPDKAILLLGRTASGISKSKKILSAEDIATEISEMTHVPVSAVTDDESQKILHIREEMQKMVIGQDPALVQIDKALKRARVGIRDEEKPIASFLFIGTTGVGKTQTAKALAQSYFGDAKTMIRLDMSEYQTQDSISKLIGNSDGSSSGLLTDAVRSKPFSLILLDEVEKAYSSILLTFLQVLDDGRLTDSQGRTADFTNSIIIATSNVGTRSIQEVSQRGGTFEQMNEVAMNDVRNHFAPEFLNRFTGIIVFKPLSRDTVKKIAEMLLNNVKKIADDKGIKVSFKPELLDELVNRGFNEQWGARPLARVIEETVETYIATKILEKEFEMGDEVELGSEVFSLE